MGVEFGRSLTVALAASVTLVVPALAAGGKCQDVPLRVTIRNPVVDPATGAQLAAAIVSDGADYVHGVAQVSATLKVCSGTGDAALNLATSKRSITAAFPSPLAGSVIEGSPAWVPGTHSLAGGINVRNLTFSREPFATHAGATFTLPADRSTYRLGFKGFSPDLPNAPNLTDPARTPGDNVPFPSSFVVVYPNYPAVCGAGSMPSWDVVAASPNSPGTTLAVGTLHKQASRGGEIHQGQYSMPFEMRIEARANARQQAK
jgi:hypothetical protein